MKLCEPLKLKFENPDWSNNPEFGLSKKFPDLQMHVCARAYRNKPPTNEDKKHPPETSGVIFDINENRHNIVL
jgi:hypothetical protein